MALVVLARSTASPKEFFASAIEYISSGSWSICVLKKNLPLKANCKHTSSFSVLIMLANFDLHQEKRIELRTSAFKICIGKAK